MSGVRVPDANRSRPDRSTPGTGYEALLVERRESTCLITLNRPDKRNSLSATMHEEIIDALSRCREDPEILVVVLTGADPAFCGGFDLTEAGHPERAHELLELSNRYHHAVWSFPKPIVCAVNGAALGGGCDLTTMCDLRLASDRAVFAQPQLAYGVPTVYSLLRWLIGDGRAREMCLTGREIDAEEAVEIGLASRLIPHGELIGQAVSAAATIAKAPTEVVQIVKRGMVGAGARGFAEVIEAEHDGAFRAAIAPHLAGALAARATDRLGRQEGP